MVEYRQEDGFDLLGILAAVVPETAAMGFWYVLVNPNLFDAAVAGILAGAMARLGLGVGRRILHF